MPKHQVQVKHRHTGATFGISVDGAFTTEMEVREHLARVSPELEVLSTNAPEAKPVEPAVVGTIARKSDAPKARPAKAAEPRVKPIAPPEAAEQPKE